MQANEHVEQEEHIEDDVVEFTDLDQPDDARNSKFFGLAVSALQCMCLGSILLLISMLKLSHH